MTQPGQSKCIHATALANTNSVAAFDLRNIHINLKQWRMFHAVVAYGSFANAAEFLHVTQPAISYTIAKIENQLGVPLLKLEGRKAKLTEQGNALLERVRLLLREAAELEEFAENIRMGCGPQVRLAVDQHFPTYMLIPALRTFSLRGREVKVHLIEVPSIEIEKVLRSRAADLAINEHVPSGFHGDLLIETEYVIVARPEHPLFRLKREITQADLDREVRVVSNSEMANQFAQKSVGPGIAQRWQVSNFDTAESALSEGIGYGWLPKHRIEKSLQSGRLKILPLRSGAVYKSNFYIIHARPSAPSSDASRLAEFLHSIAASYTVEKTRKTEAGVPNMQIERRISTSPSRH